MAEAKNCKQCQTKFAIKDENLEFYKKISPIFDGKIFNLPSPTLCYECRLQRRFAQRNENNLYYRTCDLCGKQTLTNYDPDKKLKIFCSKCWHSDRWDGKDYARNYENGKSFFKQFHELEQLVPLYANKIVHSDNCEFCNQIVNCSDCYLLFTSKGSKNCYYSQFCHDSFKCFDCFNVEKCENCYECINVNNSYGCFLLKDSENCRDCWFGYGLVGCEDCIGSNNLKHKKYYVFNKEYSKEEYQRLKLQLLNDFKITKEKFFNDITNFPHRFAQIKNCENCSGDVLRNSRNLQNCFFANSGENCTNYIHVHSTKDSMDSMGGVNNNLCYESQSLGTGNYNVLFCSNINACRDSYYLTNCTDCESCFGCVGLKNKKYYILNKEFSGKNYEKEVARIISEMTRQQEWGEFLPMKIAPFSYNESFANIHFPLTEKQIREKGLAWLDKEENIKTPEEFYDVKEVSYYNKVKEAERLLNGTMKCQVSGRAFKIQPAELAFYLEYRIPISEIHPQERLNDRLKENFSYKLFHRVCMNESCTNEFETTYAPERPEKVYCEGCYQKSVI